MGRLIILLILTSLVALLWAFTIYLILIRRVKNRVLSLAYNSWTAIMMGLNMLVCLPGLWSLPLAQLPKLGQQLWLLVITTDSLATAGLIMMGLSVLLLRVWPHPRTTDYLVVLGAGLSKGQVPPVLAARLNSAGRFWKVHPETVVIVSGGDVHGDQVTQARAMADYLQRLGVAATKILLEPQARNTWQNLVNSRQLIDQHWHGEGKPRVTVVTSSFHVPRAMLYTHRLGLNWHFLSAPTPWPYLPLTLVRDYLGIIRDHRRFAGAVLLVILMLGESLLLK